MASEVYSTSLLPRSVGTEARLLVALARSPSSVNENRVAALLGQGGVDWRMLTLQAAEHHVLPFIYYNLKHGFADSVPDAALQQLRAAYLYLYQPSIQIRGALPRLLDYLEDCGIEALTFKGPSLAALAYSKSQLRTFTDLDILVAVEDVKPAVEALKQAGFREKNPIPDSYAATWDTYWPWHPPHGNANGYVREQGMRSINELHVDLHWGLASRYFQFPLEPGPLRSRSEPVVLEDGAVVQTFSPADTLLVQCMHAAKDAYHQLGHICDIAELLRSHPELDLEAVLRRARAARCERMIQLGLLLSHKLVGVFLPATVREYIQTDATEALAHQVGTALFKKRHGINLLLHRCRFHVQVRDRWTDGLGAVYNAFRTSMRPTEEDRNWMELPPALEGFYPAVRLARSLWESARNRSGK
jgi:hypothetical protein